MRDYVYGLEPYVVADVQMEALEGSLADLLKTVQEMIGQYGADAMIQFQGGCIECGEIEGSIRRRATAEEIAAQKARDAAGAEVNRVRRQQLFEKLKAEFESASPQTCDCSDDGVMSVLGESCQKHRPKKEAK